MFSSPYNTFQLLIRSQGISSVHTHDAVSHRHPWINGPFTHVMFIRTNLNFWPPQYPVVVTPAINICIKRKRNVLFLFLSLFLSFFLSFLLSFLSFLSFSVTQTFIEYLLVLTVQQTETILSLLSFPILFFSKPRTLCLFKHFTYESYFILSIFLFFFLVLLEFLHISETTHAVFKMWKTGSYHTLQWFLSFQSIRLLIKQTMKVCNLLLPHLSRSNCYRCSWDLAFLEGILDIG